MALYDIIHDPSLYFAVRALRAEEERTRRVGLGGGGAGVRTV